MIIPDRLRIGGIDYDVRIEDLGRENLLGESKHREHVIRIDEPLSQQRKEVVLLHEALHAVANEYCMEFEEREIELLANALYALLKNNPEVFCA